MVTVGFMHKTVKSYHKKIICILKEKTMYILYVHMNNNTVLIVSEHKKLFHGVEGCKVSALHAEGIRNCITLYNST